MKEKNGEKEEPTGLCLDFLLFTFPMGKMFFIGLSKKTYPNG